MMNVLSLFDGMRCGRIALERAGIEVDNYYSSEIDPFAIKIANKNYPQDEINMLGDVTKIDFFKLPKIDLLIGGSPCQGFSFSGRRKGMVTKENIEIFTLEQYLELKNNGFEFEGQSYLFWEYIYTLKICKPKYWLLENVIVSNKWLQIMNEAIGTEPIILDSSKVSAQSRKRYYWTNIKNIEELKDKNLFLKDILEDTYTKEDVLSDKIHERFQFLDSNYSIGTTRPPFRTIGQRDHVFGSNQKVGCLMATDYKQPKQVYHNDYLRKMSPLECERAQTVPDNYTEGVSSTQRFKMLGNGWTIDVIAHILKSIDIQNIYI